MQNTEFETDIIRSRITAIRNDWSYAPSSPSFNVRRLRAQYRLLSRISPPRYRVISQPYPHERWNVLFLFLPTATLDVDQFKIVERVRRLSGQLLIIYASLDANTPPPAGLESADALIWKDLPGFDFSAYGIALSAIAQRSPGATVYVQNDSILGPFVDVDALVRMTPWDLTGFIASATIENHFSSFAFILRDVIPSKISELSSVISTKWAYDEFNPVVFCQETRLARVAARTMTVGSFLYTPARPVERTFYSRLLSRIRLTFALRETLDLSGDPTLGTPLELLDRGFPFLKRSLFSKFSKVADQKALATRLADLEW